MGTLLGSRETSGIKQKHKRYTDAAKMESEKTRGTQFIHVMLAVVQ